MTLERAARTHVAILLGRNARLIVQGRKTVECRLTQTARAPFGKVERGDRIYFKCTSGPFVASARAGAVECVDDLSERALARLYGKYNDRVCGDEAYWSSKRKSRYGTFIELLDVEAVSDGPAMPRSRGCAWFVLGDGVMVKPT